MDLEDIFRSQQRRIFAYFLRLVDNRQDAEELTQETFVRACEAAIRFRGDSSVSTWLFGIARRVLLEAARAGLFDRPRGMPEMAGDAEDIEERLDVQRAFSSLGIVDREALLLRDVLGFRATEAAAIVHVSPEAFRVRLHRARARLRGRYEGAQRG